MGQDRLPDSGLFRIFILPGAAVASFFSRDDIDFAAPGLTEEIIQDLTPEEVAELQFVEDTVKALHSAMTGRTPEQIKAAEVLYILALSEYSKEAGLLQSWWGVSRTVRQMSSLLPRSTLCSVLTLTRRTSRQS